MILVERAAWGATAPVGPAMKLPVAQLYIHHSVTAADDFAADMRELEKIGKARFGRFSYSYAVHPSGTVGVGAGDTIGAHTAGHNSTSLGIVFIGNYETQAVTVEAEEAFAGLVGWLVSTGRVRADFTMTPHRAVKATACPGRHVIERFAALESAARFAAVDGTVTPPPPDPAPPSTQEGYAMDYLDLSAVTATPSTWVRGRHVDNLQTLLIPLMKFVKRMDLVPRLQGPDGVADGVAGVGTREAVGVAQDALRFFGHYTGRKDFKVGDQTWKALIEF